MTLFFSYLRLLFFLGSALIGLQIPVLVDHYGAGLEAHLQESNTALAGFQRDADEFFNGSVEQLISHYERNPDQVIVAGGSNIRDIYQRNLLLQAKLADFRSGTMAAYRQTLFAPVEDVMALVWKNYDYAVKLNPTAIAFGLLIGLAAALAAELLLRFLLQLPRAMNRRAFKEDNPR